MKSIKQLIDESLEDDSWKEAISYYEKLAQELREIKAGRLKIFKRKRRGYREKKIRNVGDHYIYIVRPADWTPPKRRNR